METPIALIIDDPSARVFVYYEHGGSRFTADGRPLQDNVPNAFLCAFCDVIEARGIKGKFSIVPMPGGRGRLDTGISGIQYGEIAEWLDIAKARLSGHFAFCPEVLTHAGAIDLDTMQMMEERENDWSFRQTAETLTPYRDVLDTGGFPILTTHWQSLFSNGLGTGLRILDTVAARVNRHLCGRVQWTDYTALMQMTINRSLAHG